MLYLLFDIDGTLLLSGGAGRVAMTQAMKELYGISELMQIEVHGRTDRGIIEDLFAAHNVSLSDDTHREFSRRYHQLLPDSMLRCQGELMPGVPQLLEQLAGRDHVKLGILTGNSSEAADIKLKHFGLDHYFEFGGYGGDHHCRNDVAAAAFLACRDFHRDTTVTAGQVWVVGDTIHDISCARSIGANVVAVATGGAEIGLLDRHKPDVLLPNLEDTEGFLKEVTHPVSG